jgi:Xaa-Pro aminopeptidase
MKKIVALSVVALVFLFAASAFGLDRQPNAAYHARREALSKKTDGGVVVLFAPVERADEVYGFRQEDNFYYLTGYSEPAAALLIAPAVEAKDKTPARPYTEILFLPAHNTVQEKWTGPKLGPDDPDAMQRTGFDHVEVLDKLRDELVRLLPARASVYSDLPEYGETSASVEGLDWLKRANAFLGFVSFKDAKPLVASLRTIKDPGEIELIRKAVDASDAAHLAAMKAMKPGINEHDISALMQYEWNKRGCDRPAYAPIVGAGFNSTVLHYSADDAPIQNGDVIVIDAAGEYAMYASDITRTLPANGKFSARQREIYDIVLGAQQAAMNAFVSGKSKLTGRDDPNSLFKVAFEYINTHGKDSYGEPLGKYFIHGLGHYVGLNVHDAGDYTIPLAPGMVFTIEPGIYIPEEKLGVRIEDDYWVDPSGKLIKLSGSFPSTAEEVEKAMAGR